MDHKSPITGLAREVVNYLANELRVLGRSLAGNHSHTDCGYAVETDHERNSADKNHPDYAFIEPSKEIRSGIAKRRASFASRVS